MKLILLTRLLLCNIKLFPAFPISNLLEKKNLTQFLGIIERAGLKTEMDSWSDVTLFIPTDVAIETFLRKAGNNRMKNVLEYEGNNDSNFTY